MDYIRAPDAFLAANPLSPGHAILVQFHPFVLEHRLSNSIDNSEFGVRYSTLLPIGNGLQMSLIYMYLNRFPKTGLAENEFVDPFPGRAKYCGASDCVSLRAAGIPA